MDLLSLLLFLAVLFGSYMAWSIGANDAANAIGTAVGSGALTLRRAVIIAAVLEFSGAVFLGSHVSETLQSGLFDPTIFANAPNDYVIGMLAALFATASWLQVASYKGWPVSTTHSIVGAVLGFGLLAGGIDAIKWSEVAMIATSWVISPLMGAACAYYLFTFIRTQIFCSPNPTKAAKKAAPVLCFFLVAMLVFLLVFQGSNSLSAHFTFVQALLVAAASAHISSYLFSMYVYRIQEPKSCAAEYPDASLLEATKTIIEKLEHIQNACKKEAKAQASFVLDEAKSLEQKLQRIEHSHYERADFFAVEKIFAALQTISAGAMAFAHGANDVANAIGPVAGILAVLKDGVMPTHTDVPLWILILGGAGISVGLMTWGWRVIETIGHKITALTPSRGFAAEFAAAITIVLASRLGLPISTTHTLVGAVMGVGLARGLHAINLDTLKDIALSWCITIPAGALFTVFFYSVFQYAIRAVYIL